MFVSNSGSTYRLHSNWKARRTARDWFHNVTKCSDISISESNFGSLSSFPLSNSFVNSQLLGTCEIRQFDTPPPLLMQQVTFSSSTCTRRWFACRPGPQSVEPNAIARGHGGVSEWRLFVSDHHLPAAVPHRKKRQEWAFCFLGCFAISIRFVTRHLANRKPS